MSPRLWVVHQGPPFSKILTSSITILRLDYDSKTISVRKIIKATAQTQCTLSFDI